MVNENGLWNETPNIFVAFLDIMGFKDRVFREKHDDVKGKLYSLLPTIQDIEKNRKMVYLNQKRTNQTTVTTNKPSSLIYPVSFSDSVILFSKDESEDSAIEIIISAALIISEAIKNEIPMKGAIAFGEMTVDKINSLFFGIPLIDAYELHKELKIYGVVLHHSAQKRFNELLGKARIFRSLFTANDSVPMKSGSIEHTLINWMFFVHNPLNLVNKFYYNVSGAPRIYIDNTIKFVRDYLAAMERFRIEAEQQGLLKKTKS